MAAERTAVMVVGTRLRQESLALLLEHEAGITVVCACNAEEALAMASERSPDVIVMETAAYGRPTLSSLPALMKLQRVPRIILIGRDVLRDYITAAVELGVDACVSEEDGGEQLINALDAVRRSERYIGPIISDTLECRPEVAPVEESGAGNGNGNGNGNGANGVMKLTPREREVLELILQGRTERQVGRHLGRSPKTVHAHRTRIMKKLGAHNVVDLLRSALRLGLSRV